MRYVIPVVFALALVGFAAGPAVAAAPAHPVKTAKGQVLADARGMTLYTFDKDKPGQSNCNGKCAEKWPALKVEAGAEPAGDWSVVSRSDGSKMWAYRGKPLYTWAKDKKPGQTTGDGVGKLWHVARP